jgi:hypothetical protein
MGLRVGFVAPALALAVVLAGAAPAGAAGYVVECRGVLGSLTFDPPLGPAPGAGTVAVLLDGSCTALVASPCPEPPCAATFPIHIDALAAYEGSCAVATLGLGATPGTLLGGTVLHAALAVPQADPPKALVLHTAAVLLPDAPCAERTATLVAISGLEACAVQPMEPGNCA